MLLRYIFYGLLGVSLEIFFTGFLSLLKNDLTLEGKSYIWMFFIYGLSVFLEPIHDKIRNENILVRGLIYTVLIYIVELYSGSLIMKLIGECPWSYKDSINVDSIINPEFLPIWFALGLFLERVHDFLDNKIRLLL
ncbi:hypothetical protein E9840_06980 [Tissierella creatinini]|nr:hypothetical protein E9840_06980 [Tissierella creatinini]TJX63808.1 hypothetical protein E8P77_14180 [Soehngenia saccharolytica]